MNSSGRVAWRVGCRGAMRRTCGLVVAATVALAGPALPAWGASPGASLEASGGFWLLDLAWHQAASLTRAPDHVDAVELSCLLRAATRLDPKLGPAWLDQYDLLAGLGRQAEALEALARYVAVLAGDEPAALAYAVAQIGRTQTAEERIAACREWLTRRDLPAAAVAFLHRTVGEILQSRLQTAEALEHAQQAVKLFPYDIQAQRLLLDLQGRTGPLADLHLNLWMLRRNPAAPAAILRVARVANDLGLHAEATAWYTAGQRILAKLEQNGEVLLLDMADHDLDAGRPDLAVDQLAALVSRAQPPVEAHLLLAEAYSMMDKPQEARQAAVRAIQPADTQPATAPATQAATAPATQPATAPATQATTAPATQAAEIPATAQKYARNAWVRLMYLDDAAGALPAARTAFEIAADQTWARRTYGWALLRSGQAAQAIEILQPIARSDAWSALGLADALHQADNAGAAAEVLQTVERLAPGGPVRRAARRWAAGVNLTVSGPDPARQREARQMLQGFNMTLLEMPVRPDKFLKLGLALDVPPPPGAPWLGRVELTNLSDLAIYCGPDGAVVPSVLLSGVVYDLAFRDIGQRLLLSLRHPFILEPGKSLVLRRPIDSGPLRQLLCDPTKDLSVAFTLILDPVKTADGRWLPGPAGMITEPVEVKHPAAAARYDDLLEKARAGTPAQRIEAARQIACLLAASQARTPGATRPAWPDDASLSAAMAGLLADKDPMVAAHALAQADTIRLTDPLVEAAAPQVGAEHWLVRLLAVRLMAHQQGAKFTRALGGMARADPDPLVRDLAAAYHVHRP